MYSEDDFLLLSGIQHFAFCQRQWALIHIEQQWEENVKTIEGHHVHDRVDEPFLKDSGSNLIVWRSVGIISYSLGLTGRCDVLEFKKNESGIELEGKSGKWKPYPVEYKRGKPKPDERDEVQLCAQAMCLEEMLDTEISEGALYYWEERHRTIVDLTGNIRDKVKVYAAEMHNLFSNGITPLPEYKPHCKSCSLVNICLPKGIKQNRSATDYLKFESILFPEK